MGGCNCKHVNCAVLQSCWRSCCLPRGALALPNSNSNLGTWAALPESFAKNSPSDLFATSLMTTSLCIMILYPHDVEELKKSPPSSLVNLCAGSDKICCFYNEHTNKKNSTDKRSRSLIGASIDGNFNDGNFQQVCSENVKKCSDWCCDRIDHCTKGTCPNKSTKSAGKKIKLPANNSIAISVS